jgi:hypothetical protein
MYFIDFLASLDLVRHVQSVLWIDEGFSSNIDKKTVDYNISWLPPLSPNGLIYFYTIRLDQYVHNGPKDERCVGHDINSIQVSLLPRTNYRLTIMTYTVARLNREYDDQFDRSFHDDLTLMNTSHVYYQVLLTTADLPSKSIDTCRTQFDVT